MSIADIGTVDWTDYPIDVTLLTLSVDPDFIFNLAPSTVVSGGAETSYRGSIKFCVEGVEMLRLAPDGDIFVRGSLAANDKAVVAGMVEMLRQLNLLGSR